MFTKKSKAVTASDAIKVVTGAKGETCALQTGKLCYDTIKSLDVLVLVYACRIARQLNLLSVMVLDKGVFSVLIQLKLRSAVHAVAGSKSTTFGGR